LIFLDRSGVFPKILCNRDISPLCPLLLPSFRLPVSFENILFFELFINFDKMGTQLLGKCGIKQAGLAGFGQARAMARLQRT
jgi:hypothetical protein